MLKNDIDEVGGRWDSGCTPVPVAYRSWPEETASSGFNKREPPALHTYSSGYVIHTVMRGLVKLRDGKMRFSEREPRVDGETKRRGLRVGRKEAHIPG